MSSKKKKKVQGDSSQPIPPVKPPFKPLTPQQHAYAKAIEDYDCVVAYGPAGTGKTYVAIRKAVEALQNGLIEKIVISRPVVEAGEKLGFLPGTYEEKIHPYLIPLFDALGEALYYEQLRFMLDRKIIEIVPLAFMRGRTFKKSYVILDEAQNATAEQMLMLLTRLGEGSKMVVNGDTSQIDLDRRWQKSGLIDAAYKLRDVPGICVFNFRGAKIIRHELVEKIIHAYEKDKLDKKQDEEPTESV